MRILHCAGFNEQKLGQAFYSTDRKISNGLIRNGHCVYDFSYRYYAKRHTPLLLKYRRSETTEKALLEITKNFEPDLLMLGKSENIGADVLKIIRDRFPEIKIGMWWVDPIYILGDIEEKLSLLDGFFLTTDPKELSRVFNNKGLVDKSRYLPNICDSTIDSYKGFECNSYKHDVLFIGRNDANRNGFIEDLKSIGKNLNVGLYGQKGNLLLGNKYLQTISQSKISLNFSRYNDLSMYSSDRIVHLAANGSMVLSSRVPNIETVFSENEVAYFDDKKSMLEKIDWYLHHEEERLQLAKAGWQRAHEDYSEVKVTKFMIDTIFS